MIKFILGFIVGVLTIWTYGLYRWYRMTLDEWEGLREDLNDLVFNNYQPSFERELSESTTQHS